MTTAPPEMPHEANPFRSHSGPVNDLDNMSLSDLLALRNQVEQRLPARDLKDMDLNRELVLQVLALQQLQSDVLNDEDVPANQQAQVANSLSAALTTLVKLQADVYTSERLKRLEAIYVDALRALPEPAQHDAIAAYAAMLESN